MVRQTNSSHKWLALMAMSLGVFMALLDVTVVNVALPTMALDFHTTFNDLQWVLNAYTIVFAVTLLITSKLGDMYGRKRVFMISMVIFIVGSIMNGLAPSLLVLDFGRGVQGIGGAGMNSLSMALVGSNFKGRDRGTGLGILGSVIGLSSAVGPLVGGYLVEHFGWPAIFFVNVPIGIVALVMTYFYVAETPSYGRGEKIDFLGMFLSAAALFSAVFGLIKKEAAAHVTWTSPDIVFWLVAAAIFLIIFVLVEMKTPAPMMDLKMFTQINFVGAIIVAFALGAGIYAMSTYLTALMQNYMGYTALETGVRQLTISIWSLLLGPLTGYIGQRFSKRWLIAGFMFWAGLAFIWLANVMVTKVTFLALVPGMVMYGITNGLVNPLLNNAGLDDVKQAEMGMGSGLLNVFRQVGVTFGVVILGLTQTNHYEAQLNAHWFSLDLPTAISAPLHRLLISAGPFSGHQLVFADLYRHLPFSGDLQSLVEKAYYSGMAAVFFAAALIVSLGGLAAALLMRDSK